MKYCKDQDSEDTFSKIIIEKNSSINVNISESVIFFVIQGEISINIGEYSFHATQGCCFVPIIGQMFLRTNTDGLAEIIQIKLSVESLLCSCFPLHALMQYRSDFDTNIPFVLNYNDEFKNYLKSLAYIINDCEKCPSTFLEVKVSEMFFLFMRHYTRKDLYKFFYHHITGDVSFQQAVFKHYTSVESVQELSSALNFSLSGFQKHFKRVFKMPPHLWIKEQKKKGIVHDLMQQRLPIKIVSEKYKFSSIPHFYSFCKREFKQTPAEIKKQVS